MASVAKGLVGKRVYRMSSHAPNRGVVNPSGYIKREMAKKASPTASKMKPMPKLPMVTPIQKKPMAGVSKVGKDGMSDTRSGLAQAALKRMVKKMP